MLAVNRIYMQYKAQKISRQEAISFLLAEIFKSPRYYHLGSLDEDEVSCFIVWIHDHIPKILDNYNEETSSFITYFTSAVRIRFRGWRRDFVKKRIFQSILDAQHRSEQADHPLHGYSVAETAQDYLAGTRRRRTPLSTRQALTVLVLALRSLHTLNGSIIDRIPALTGVSRQEFHGYMARIEEGMRKKKALFDHLEARINRAYILQQQYALELSSLDADSHQYFLVEHQYQHQREVLQRLRTLRQRFKLRPSGRLIEEALGIPSGSVRRILLHADRRIAQIRQLLDQEKE